MSHVVALKRLLRTVVSSSALLAAACANLFEFDQYRFDASNSAGSAAAYSDCAGTGASSVHCSGTAASSRSGESKTDPAPAGISVGNSNESRTIATSFGGTVGVVSTTRGENPAWGGTEINASSLALGATAGSASILALGATAGSASSLALGATAGSASSLALGGTAGNGLSAASAGTVANAGAATFGGAFPNLINPTTPCGQARDSMVCLEGATFEIGNDQLGQTHHWVTILPFYLDVFEVTVENFDACVLAGGCMPPAVPSSDAGKRLNECNAGIAGREQHPINCVRWDQASQYCRWAGSRLPTEEEWLYAAHGGQSSWPWGEEEPSALRVNLYGDERTGLYSAWGADGYLATAPVGSFPLGATPGGIHDLYGNVWEILSSRLCDFPSEPCNSCPLDAECASPCDACSTNTRVVRGGSWAEQDISALLSHRGATATIGGAGTDYIGFRCARSGTLSNW